MREDDRSHHLLKKQILILNRHLPRRRKTLQDLIQEDKPHVVGSDGIRHRFNNEEIKFLTEIIESDDLRRIKLPIYIEINSKNSGYKISGIMETKVVCKILKIENCDDPLFIYRNDMKKLRKKLPSTTQYIFLR